MSCKISHYFKRRFHQMRKMNKSIFSRRELFQSPLKTAGNCCSLAFWLHQYSCSCHVQLSRWLCHPFSYTWAIKKLFFPFLTCLCGFWVNWLFLSSQDMCSTAVRQQKPSDLATSDIWRHPSTCGNHVQSDLSCAGTGYGENCPPYSNSSWLDGKVTRHLWKVRTQPV